MFARLDHRHTAWVRRQCADDPAGTITIARLIEGSRSAALSTPGGTLYGCVSESGTLNGTSLDGTAPAHEPSQAYWVGTTIAPLTTSAVGTAQVAGLLAQHPRRRCSLVGYAEPVLDIYRQLSWGPPRGVRPCQPLLVASAQPSVEALPVRVAGPGDVGQVYAASVAMFTEEVGFSPVLDGNNAYRSRVADLVRAGHTYVIIDSDRRVVFKADVGLAWSGAVQIQGVWVHPEFRGRGIATRAMVSVTQRARAVAPVVSLYVNGFNAGALRAYHKAGYRQVGEFATVMY